MWFDSIQLYIKTIALSSSWDTVGTGKPYVATSGSALCGDTGESPAKEGQASHGPRSECEQAALKVCSKAIPGISALLALHLDQQPSCLFVRYGSAQTAAPAAAQAAQTTQHSGLRQLQLLRQLSMLKLLRPQACALAHVLLLFQKEDPPKQSCIALTMCKPARSGDVNGRSMPLPSGMVFCTQTQQP